MKSYTEHYAPNEKPKMFESAWLNIACVTLLTIWSGCIACGLLNLLAEALR